MEFQIGVVNVRIAIYPSGKGCKITLIYPIGETRMEWCKIYIKPSGEYPVIIEKQDYERGDKSEEEGAIS